MTETQIGEVIVKLHQGDITVLQVDAIVNAANSDFSMGSGVAGAIIDKGGYGIEEEAVAQVPISPGEAVITLIAFSSRCLLSSGFMHHPSRML